MLHIPLEGIYPMGGKKMASIEEQEKIKRTCGTTEVPPEIFKHWTHSHEEDTEDVEVYRPHDFKFPPARGRTGFEIKENGEFIQYDIGPACGIEEVMGFWKAEGKNKIRVWFESQKRESYTLSIVSCDEDMLRIKQRR